MKLRGSGGRKTRSRGTQLDRFHTSGDERQPQAEGGESESIERVAVLLNDTQLREHAKTLAQRHRVQIEGGGEPLRPRLDLAERDLGQAFTQVREATAHKRRVEPAAEWLLDNFVLVKEQARIVREGLPDAYSRQLPILVGGGDEGLPRILVIVRELVVHVDGRADERILGDFVRAYQTHAALTLGELWAMPVMLRLALIERMAVLGHSIMARLRDYAEAADWAQQMLDTVRNQEDELILLVADMARAKPADSRAFAAEFFRLLQGRHPALALPMAWIEQRITQRHWSMARLLEEEGRVQAFDQVSIRNCINSLRVIAHTRWAGVVEAVSVVERILKRDPARVYARMDFHTRDRYRHVVEEIARRGHLDEHVVANGAVQCALDAKEAHVQSPRRLHVGYYLIDAGRSLLEETLGVRPDVGQRLRRAMRARPTPVHLGMISILTVVIALLTTWAGAQELLFEAPWAVYVIAVLLASSYLAVALTDLFFSHLLRPQLLPRMNFENGIPGNHRTLVVVPCMLTSAAGIQDELEHLELCYLGNREPNLGFALLTDFTDATQPTTPEDANLLATVQAGVNRLNAQHAATGPCRFYLFHRSRQWSAEQRLWMGLERKRGKLTQLNRFLRGASADVFSSTVGDLNRVRHSVYVITLDADTELPPHAAVRLVETMAHPLNQPRFDRRQRRVVEGYGILQPRVSVGVEAGNASLFARLFSDDTGLDPYTRAISNVYQDLFAESSYIGKGLYHVKAFSCAVGTRFPDNLILSHDLLEGSYARTGLVSDVELREHHPQRYSTEARRRHRWVRGDWQILDWLLPLVPGPRKRWLRNRLKAHHRWKIFDNVRRSLVPVAFAALWVRSWIEPSHPLFWTLTLLLFLVVEPVLAVGLKLVSKDPAITWRMHGRETLEMAFKRFLQTGLLLALLPYEAMLNVSAILRSAFRLVLTRRNLLEWTPASSLDHAAARRLDEFLRMMWLVPVGVVLTLAAVLMRDPGSVWPASPLLLLWLLGPWVAWASSRPWSQRSAPPLNATQRALLGQIARRTWRYFDDFVTAEHHWLPPDNHQAYPTRHTAPRTSPTNIGLSLLANVSAGDFGYITPTAMLDRCEKTLETMTRLQRHDGHFLNWYDTRTLAPLPPAYVSSVDSGNLLACLGILRSALLAFEEQPLLPRAMLSGLADTLGVVRAGLGHTSGSTATATDDPMAARIDAMLATLRQAHDGPADIAAWRSILHACEVLAATLSAPEVPDLSPPAAGKRARRKNATRTWSKAFARQCTQWMRLLDVHTSCVQRLSGSPTSPELQANLEALNANPSLAQARLHATRILAWIDADATAGGSEGSVQCAVRELLEEMDEQCARAAALAGLCVQLSAVDFRCVWDARQQLLSIGYNVEQGARDVAHYDLLASEARLGSFVGIARQRLPQSHWFALGRTLTSAAGRTTLLSWSGSMFEYLMPLLVMPSFENTLLDRACRAAIDNQIAYGRQLDVPWGISESAYNTTDAHLTYQYRAFGVPGLGLKRGLADDVVVAPYASMMSLSLRPLASVRNLERLADLGALADHGFYEALDFTRARVAPGESFALVRQFMAHHQGMGLLGISAVLHDQPMQQRFLSDPEFRASQLLLRERVPIAAPIGLDQLHAERPELPVREDAPAARVMTRFNTSVPQVQLMSNGSYHVMISQAGGGYSRYNDLAITAWRKDGTRDADGQFCYVRDLDSGRVWSNTLQPTHARADDYVAIFSQARAEFKRSDDGIQTRTQIAVSPEENLELRRIRVTNHSTRTRHLELTSYVEVALAHTDAMAAHPAFNKLFVETELVQGQAVLAHRRPRTSEERHPYLLHLMLVRGSAWSEPSFETSRETFIGRGRTLARPRALLERGELSGTSGAVLDPIVAVRRSIVLGAGKSAVADLVTAVAETRADALRLIEHHLHRHLDNRVFELAWTHAQVLRQQLNVGDASVGLHVQLAGSVLYPDPRYRVPRTREVPSQSGLWKYGISGDLPIVLLRVADMGSFNLVREVVQAHAYWRLHGMHVDLVIWNENVSGYRQELQDRIMGLVAVDAEAAALDRPGGIFIRRIEHVSAEDRALMLAVARVVLIGGRGSLQTQMKAHDSGIEPQPRMRLSRRLRHASTRFLEKPADLEFDNGYGGFSQDGREYVTWLPAGVTTPAPWANVIANPGFGTVVSESGNAYTWSGNAHDLRLTPWHNDPVCDSGGEAFYIRDELSGQFWSPTPLPARAASPYRVAHGFGYSRFESMESDIHCTLTTFVPTTDAVKYVLIELHNVSAVKRQLSLTGYMEWVLGELRMRSAAHVCTSMDPSSKAIFADNFFSDAHARMRAFFVCSDAPTSFTGDRREFIGRNGDLSVPSAMFRQRLSDHVGAGLDPCAAIQTLIDLDAGETRAVVFVVGVGTDAADARRMASRTATVAAAHQALQAVHAQWERLLGCLNVRTPDRQTDLLVNGWLVYQVISARLWGRSGYYQSGGAYGFRDQLQDVMALVQIHPRLAREQILRCAAHQYVEGDVQHWWHPPGMRGVRTTVSDDYLWLPWVTAGYVAASGDQGVLDESIAFIEGRALNSDEESYYDFADPSAQTASLYEHCRRAIGHGLRFGEHGLPLMGGGDWNDGMNRVGVHGRGESVWLGFFLYDVMRGFIPLARARGDTGFVSRLEDASVDLARNIDARAWDGDWYLRAFTDDGKKLGSATNDECRIDSIAQSWATLSGAGTPQRAAQALESAQRHLVRSDLQLVQLFAPPFDHSTLDPGYIKGYVPGVRENGGQYTHAAVWFNIALAERGRADAAWNIFRMLQPIRHAQSADEADTYRVEPYVVAADIYATQLHPGRGGWTWYTGAAGWMYRLASESLLGLRRAGDRLCFKPCIPADWMHYDMDYRFRDTLYRIHVERDGPGNAVRSVSVDGAAQSDGCVQLIADDGNHDVAVVLGGDVPS